MKKVIFSIFVLVLFFWSSAVLATSLVCDPPTVTGVVDSYTITGLPSQLSSINNIPILAQADGSLKVDVNACPTGSFPIQVYACNSLWGSCSAATNFTLTRPVTPGIPANIHLVK